LHGREHVGQAGHLDELDEPGARPEQEHLLSEPPGRELEASEVVDGPAVRIRHGRDVHQDPWRTPIEPFHTQQTDDDGLTHRHR